MTTIEDLAGLAVLFGIAGVVLGYLCAVGVGRWISDSSRAAWISCAILIAVLLVLTAVAIWLTPTEPSSSADARQHDYSLAGLWIAAVVWVGLINSGGAALGTALARLRTTRKLHDQEMLRRARA